MKSSKALILLVGFALLVTSTCLSGCNESETGLHLAQPNPSTEGMVAQRIWDGPVLQFLPLFRPIVVSTTLDEFDSVDFGQGCSLREAITAANTDRPFGGCMAGFGADTIILPDGLYELTRTGKDEDGNETGDLDINGDLKILGSGMKTTYVSGCHGSNSDRIFHIFADHTVSIENLTVKLGQLMPGGDSDFSYGGTIYNDGDTTLKNCMIEQSDAFDGGGAIFNTSSLLLDTCILRKNMVHMGPGGGVYSSGSLIVRYCSFENNNAQKGGAINNDGGTAEILSSTFSNNMGFSVAGAVYSDGSMTITTSTFSRNETLNSGGAILNEGTMTVVSCTIYQNMAANGGGIFSTYGSYLLLWNSIISENYVSHTGLDVVGTIDTESDYNIITDIGRTEGIDCETANNICEVDPELDRLWNYEGFTETHNPLPESPAIDNGSCLDPNGEAIAVDQRGLSRPDPDGPTCDIGAVEEQSYISDPDYDRIPIIVTTVLDENNEGDEIGEGCSLREAILAANRDEAYGGCTAGRSEDIIQVPEGTYVLTQGKQLKIESGMEIVGAGPDLTIIDGNGDLAEEPHRVIKIHSTTMYPCSVRIADMTIRNGQALENSYRGAGGGIHVYYNAVLALENCMIKSNTAYASGGGIHNEGELTVDSCTFYDNEAMVGGGIASYNYGYSLLTVRSSTFSNNRGRSNDDFEGFPLDNIGGAIFASDAETRISSTRFVDNQADCGGAVYCSSNDMILEDSDFERNIASGVRLGKGGAIRGGGEIRSCNFTDNEAVEGGAIHGGGEIRSCNFTDNEAVKGGAIWTASTTLTGSTLSGNLAEQGGGIFCKSGSLIIRSSTLHGNRAVGADSQGGGLNVVANTLIETSTFFGNEAANGGAIFTRDYFSVFDIVSSTISGNQASEVGGGVNNEANATIRYWSSIISGNDAPQAGTNIIGAAHTGSDFNLIGEDTDMTGIGNGSGSNIWNPDPMLGPLSDNGGATLTMLPESDSPVIDAGSTTNPDGEALEFDQRGMPRPAREGELSDIGAVEVQ